MPIWDFKCINCGSVEERLAKQDEIVLCEECGSETKRLVGRPGGFILKGSGFYQTDYKETDAAKRAADKLAEADPSAPALDQE